MFSCSGAVSKCDPEPKVCAVAACACLYLQKHIVEYLEKQEKGDAAAAEPAAAETS